MGSNEVLMRLVYVEKSPTRILVVAGAIRDGAGRLLLQQCPAHKRHAGLWEFPGGKVEDEEIPQVALCREIAEELSITLDPAAIEPVGFAEEGLGEGLPAIVLLLYTCRAWSGEPTALEGQTWGWFTREEAARLELPPMDRRLLAALPG